MRLPGPADLAATVRDSAAATAHLVGAARELLTLIPRVDEAVARIITTADQASVVISRISDLTDEVGQLTAATAVTVRAAQDLLPQIDATLSGVDAVLGRAGHSIGALDAVTRKASRTATLVDQAVAPLVALGPLLAAVGEVDLEVLRRMLAPLPELLEALAQVGLDVGSLRGRVDDLHHLAVGIPGGRRLLRKGAD